ncbi:vacuolar iron transporter homolog 2-like [Silene latifolia]|uniref:vacuolar iron transporter homolog 2-like n=1 Tax=Silene latifolia TaxID=37657 RepID=UPI003D78210E
MELVIIHPTNDDRLRLEDVHHPANQPNHRRNIRSMVLTANDGLTCTACLMIGVGAMSLNHVHVTLAMIITGVAGLIMGASCMALGEFVSRNCELDFEDVEVGPREVVVGEEEVFSNDPQVAAAATALAFSVGAMVPLVVVLLVREYNLGLGVVEGATSTVLAMVGWLGPFLGRAPAIRAALRVLLCGWLTMAITFGIMIVIIGNN